ncbi:MAG TPA: phenylalanine--tRNA ligase subunit beta [Thermoanaerobacterales bacterium]|nr:phenylalanine--tRNA ligase subunit beta [Thermoanaerobacterales bacterium]
MLVPISWVKEFVDFDCDTNELAERLTMSGSNVEGIDFLGKDIKKVIVGEIEEIKEHPDADKLVIAYVNTGSERLQIVTGATNIKEGDKVPVAIHGSTIAGGKKIRASKLRGVESAGMLCSAEELGFDDHGLPEEMKNGIMILPKDVELGIDVKDYLALDDTVIDFEITPNRSDCLSIIGMAREIAATFRTSLNVPKINVKEEGQSLAKDKANITIEDEDLCRRYVARLIEDVVIEPSPLWMQRRLQSAGVRSINNIVDITNYVMLEMGQPLHAFDYDKLEGHSIIVRRGKNSEKIETLDDTVRDITEDMLVIADMKKPVAIAGVMGGAYSEISSSTKRILLESANFFGPNIRRTSRKLGLRSESSMRYEKGIDPNLCLKAADRACELIEQLGAGKVLKGYIDVYPGKPVPRKISFKPDNINRVLGTNIDTEAMIEILHHLEIPVEDANEGIQAIIPTFRADMTEEADIIEEIARIYGYDKLPITLPKGNVTHGKLNDFQKNIDDIRDVLTYNGYSEIYTYSFVSPKVFDKINTPDNSSLRQVITLMNPLGEDYSIMRTTLLPNMLDTISFNLNHKVGELKVYEAGNVYLPKELPLKELPYENKRIAIGICGESMDFYVLKRTIETIFKKLRVTNYKFIQDEHFAFHTSRCAKVMIGNDVIGFAGEIHPDILEKYEINKKVYIAELDLDLLLSNTSNLINFKPLPKFPVSSRDLAIVVKEKVPAGEVLDTMKQIGGNLLEDLELFDIYKGGQIAKGYKSMAFSLTFRAQNRTLTDVEVNEIIERIKDELSKKYDASLRE